MKQKQKESLLKKIENCATYLRAYADFADIPFQPESTMTINETIKLLEQFKDYICNDVDELNHKRWWKVD